MFDTSGDRSGRVDHNAPAHKWRQVADAIEDEIRSGQLAVGTRLPPEPALAAQYGVARITARKAIARLVAQGLLEIVRGRGTFVEGTGRALPARVDDAKPCEVCGVPVVSKYGVCTRNAACRERYTELQYAQKHPACEVCGSPTSGKSGVCKRTPSCRARGFEGSAAATEGSSASKVLHTVFASLVGAGSRQLVAELAFACVGSGYTERDVAELAECSPAHVHHMIRAVRLIRSGDEIMFAAAYRQAKGPGPTPRARSQRSGAERTASRAAATADASPASDGEPVLPSEERASASCAFCGAEQDGDGDRCGQCGYLRRR
jgi:DNA-binding transcriptional regulator YhcF (GntR family)